MNQLRLIWDLEKYNSIIDECKTDLSKIENSDRHKDMNKKINELDSFINHMKAELLEDSKITSKLERVLKEYDYRKMKLEEDLYCGEVTDIKQLEQLSREKDETSKLIDELESKILNLIDNTEVLEKSLSNTGDDYKKLKKDIFKTEEEFDELIKELKVKINNAEQERDKILPRIDLKILKRYDETRKKRGRGVVLINDDICKGCNVRIPTYLIADIKKQSEIIYCESCGRLLYYKED